MIFLDNFFVLGRWGSIPLLNNCNLPTYDELFVQGDFVFTCYSGGAGQVSATPSTGTSRQRLAWF
jgi:hypothetical protein